MNSSILICFAVNEEAAPCRRHLRYRNGVAIRLTGMGPRNAERFIRAALDADPPALVVSSGFAGALDPALSVGSVVIDADPDFPPIPDLASGEARSVRFHCADRVVATAAAKRSLRMATGAQAVEMESEIIRRVCRQRGIPSATFRVISDGAEEDLPLDFNEFVTGDWRMNYPKLIWMLAFAPSKAGELLRFRNRIRAAAENLASALEKLVEQIDSAARFQAGLS